MSFFILWIRIQISNKIRKQLSFRLFFSFFIYMYKLALRVITLDSKSASNFLHKLFIFWYLYFVHSDLMLVLAIISSAIKSISAINFEICVKFFLKQIIFDWLIRFADCFKDFLLNWFYFFQFLQYLFFYFRNN